MKLRYKLTARVSHKTFDEPVIHEFFYNGNTIDDILDQIDTQPQHIKNLRYFGRTRFKSQDGVKHEWRLEKLKVEEFSQCQDMAADKKEPETKTKASWWPWPKSSA